MTRCVEFDHGRRLGGASTNFTESLPREIVCHIARFSGPLAFFDVLPRVNKLLNIVTAEPLGVDLQVEVSSGRAVDGLRFHPLTSLRIMDSFKLSKDSACMMKSGAASMIYHGFCATVNVFLTVSPIFLPVYVLETQVNAFLKISLSKLAKARSPKNACLLHRFLSKGSLFSVSELFASAFSGSCPPWQRFFKSFGSSGITFRSIYDDRMLYSTIEMQKSTKLNLAFLRSLKISNGFCSDEYEFNSLDTCINLETLEIFRQTPDFYRTGSISRTQLANISKSLGAMTQLRNLKIDVPHDDLTETDYLVFLEALLRLSLLEALKLSFVSECLSVNLSRILLALPHLQLIFFRLYLSPTRRHAFKPFPTHHLKVMKLQITSTFSPELLTTIFSSLLSRLPAIKIFTILMQNPIMEFHRWSEAETAAFFYRLFMDLLGHPSLERFSHGFLDLTIRDIKSPFSAMLFEVRYALAKSPNRMRFLAYGNEDDVEMSFLDMLRLVEQDNVDGVDGVSEIEDFHEEDEGGVNVADDADA